MAIVVPAVNRLRLGRRLHELRKEAGLTIEQCEEDLDLSDSTISRIERGQQKVHPVLVRAMLELFRVPMDEWEELVELAREGQKRTKWQLLGVAAHGYVVLESEAVAVRNFEPMFVPGLLQTEGYAHEVLGLDSSMRRSHNLAIRIKRQECLTKEPPLEFHAIVDEMALRRQVGTVEVYREQLAHLIEQAKLPNVTLQVVPLRIGVHLGMRGTFSVLTFPRDTIDDIAYAEHAGGSLQLSKAEPVEKLSYQFRRIEKIALPQRESVALIAGILDEIRSTDGVD